jgi:hypothetical protein
VWLNGFVNAKDDSEQTITASLYIFPLFLTISNIIMAHRPQEGRLSIALIDCIIH